jgi:malate dehydrogenase (quinone)
VAARFKSTIPTYGIDLKQDADADGRSGAATAAILRIENV